MLYGMKYATMINSFQEKDDVHHMCVILNFKKKWKVIKSGGEGRGGGGLGHLNTLLSVVCMYFC